MLSIRSFADLSGSLRGQIGIGGWTLFRKYQKVGSVVVVLGAAANLADGLFQVIGDLFHG